MLILLESLLEQSISLRWWQCLRRQRCFDVSRELVDLVGDSSADGNTRLSLSSPSKQWCYEAEEYGSDEREMCEGDKLREVVF